jgi:hypothetical protein
MSSSNDDNKDRCDVKKCEPNNNVVDFWIRVIERRNIHSVREYNMDLAQGEDDEDLEVVFSLDTDRDKMMLRNAIEEICREGQTMYNVILSVCQFLWDSKIVNSDNQIPNSFIRFFSRLIKEMNTASIEEKEAPHHSHLKYTFVNLKEESSRQFKKNLRDSIEDHIWQSSEEDAAVFYKRMVSIIWAANIATKDIFDSYLPH